MARYLSLEFCIACSSNIALRYLILHGFIIRTHRAIELYSPDFHDSLYRTRYLHFTSHASFDVELLLSAHVSQILNTSSTFLTSRSFPLPYVHSTPNVGPTLLPLLDYRPVTRSTATPTAKKRSEAKLQALELHRRRPHDHDFTMQPRSRCVTIAS